MTITDANAEPISATLFVPVRKLHELRGVQAGSDDQFIEARLLGNASSFRKNHNHEGRLAHGQRCSACRWFEIRLYLESDAPDPVYVLYTAGWSVVPGEVTRPRVHRTSSALDVIELLTVRSADNGETFMPKANARVAAQASTHDEGMRDAYYVSGTGAIFEAGPADRG